MKVLNKLHRGKQQFKFLSLKDRLRQTDLSSVQRRRKQVLAVGDDEALARPGASLDTHLRTTIIQWSDRDRTRSFLEFANVVHPWVISLPLLLRNRKRVFRQWVRAVREQASSLAALVACWEAFAWDLATDFYPFVVPSIQVLTRSVDFGNATEIEVFFSTATRLFRFWSKQQAVAGETCRILQAWRVTLLNHRSEHVRLFAAQSAGVLLRRLANEELLACVQDMVTANLDAACELDSIRREADAVAATFFYGCTSVQGQVHSGALVLLDHLHRCVFRQDPETEQLDAYQQTLLIALWWRLGGKLTPEATARLLETTLLPWMKQAPPKRLPIVLYGLGGWLERFCRSHQSGAGDVPLLADKITTKLLSLALEYGCGESLTWFLAIYGRAVATAGTTVTMRQFLQHLMGRVSDVRITATVIEWLVTHCSRWHSVSAAQMLSDILGDTYCRLPSAGVSRASQLAWIWRVLRTTLTADASAGSALRKMLEQGPALWQVADLESADITVRTIAFYLARSLGLPRDAVEEKHRLRSVLLSDPSPFALAVMCFQFRDDTALLRTCLERTGRLADRADAEQVLDGLCQGLVHLRPEPKDAEHWAAQSELSRPQRKRICSAAELVLCAKLTEASPAPQLAGFFRSMAEIYQLGCSFTNDIQQIDTARIHFRRALVTLRQQDAAAVPRPLLRLVLFTILGCLQLPLTLFWNEVPAIWEASVSLLGRSVAFEQVFMPLLSATQSCCDWAINCALGDSTDQLHPLRNAPRKILLPELAPPCPRSASTDAVLDNVGVREANATKNIRPLVDDDQPGSLRITPSVTNENVHETQLSLNASVRASFSDQETIGEGLEPIARASEKDDIDRTVGRQWSTQPNACAAWVDAPVATPAADALQHPSATVKPPKNTIETGAWTSAQTDCSEAITAQRMTTLLQDETQPETTATESNERQMACKPPQTLPNALSAQRRQSLVTETEAALRAKSLGRRRRLGLSSSRAKNAALSSAALWPWLDDTQRALRQIWSSFIPLEFLANNCTSALPDDHIKLETNRIPQPSLLSLDELTRSDPSTRYVREVIPPETFYGNLVQLLATSLHSLDQTQRMTLVRFLLQERSVPMRIEILHWNNLGVLLAEQALHGTDAACRAGATQRLWSALQAEHSALQRAALEALFQAPNWHEEYRRAYLPPLRVLVQSSTTASAGKRTKTRALGSSLTRLREQVAMLNGALVDLEAVLPVSMNSHSASSSSADSTDRSALLYQLHARYRQIVQSRERQPLGTRSLQHGGTLTEKDRPDLMEHRQVSSKRQRHDPSHRTHRQDEDNDSNVEAMVILPEDAGLIVPLVAALLYGRARALAHELRVGTQSTRKKRYQHLLRAIMQCYGQMSCFPSILVSLVRLIQRETNIETRLLLATAMTDVILGGLQVPANMQWILADLALTAFSTWYAQEVVANKSVRRLAARLLQRVLLMVASQSSNSRTVPSTGQQCDAMAAYAVDYHECIDEAAAATTFADRMQNDWWNAMGGLSQGFSATPASSWTRQGSLSTATGTASETSVENGGVLASPDDWLKRLLPLIDGALACLSLGETTSSVPALFYPLQVLIQTDLYFEALLERHTKEAALLWRRLADCLTQTSHPNLQWFLLSLLERFVGHAERCSCPSSLVQGLVRCLRDSPVHGKHRKRQICSVPKTPEQKVQWLALRLLLQVAALLSAATIPAPGRDSAETLSITENSSHQTRGDRLVANANELLSTSNRRWMETSPAPASNEAEREAAVTQVARCGPHFGSLSLLLDTLMMLIARKSIEESLRREVIEAFTNLAGRTAALMSAPKGTDLLEQLAQLMERVDLFPVASRLRWELARSIQQVAAVMPKSSGAHLAAALLERMNRFSSTSIGQIDWDTVLAAYAYRFADEPAANWSLVIPQLSAALQYRDGALRSAAGDALVRLVLASLPAQHPDSNNFSSGPVSVQAEGHREPQPESPDETRITIALSGTDSAFRTLLHRVIMLLRKKAIQASSLTLLRTVMSVLGRLVRALPQGLDPLWVDAVAPLTSSDETQDVFETIAHVQLALRIRALARLEEAPISLTVQRELLLPLAERVLQLANCSRTSHRQVDDRGRQRAIWQASARRLVTRLAARLAPAMIWKRLAWLVRRYDRQVSNHRVVERDEVPGQQPLDETLVIRKQVDPQLLLAYAKALPPGHRQQHAPQETTTNTDHEQLHKDEQEHDLALEILERLESHLYSPQTAATSEQVPGTPAWLNRPLFETLVLVLARQPMSVMAARVPRLVTRLLRDVGLRVDQRRRDDAREALQTLVRELGPSWLSVVFQQLADSSNMAAAVSAGKQTDGSFRAHVWPYTVQVLLKTVASMGMNATPLLDTPTLERALWIALTEFRDPQIEAEKKVAKLYADVREAHVSSLWDSVSLLGQLWPRQVADLGRAFVLLVRALRHRLLSDTRPERGTESESGEYRAASRPELEQWRRLLHGFVLGITRQGLQPDHEADIQAVTVCIRYLLEKPSVGSAGSTGSVSTRPGLVQATTSVPNECARLAADELNPRTTMDSARLSTSGGIVVTAAAHHAGDGTQALVSTTKRRDEPLQQLNVLEQLCPELESFRRERRAEAYLLREAALRWAWHWPLLRSSRPTEESMAKTEPTTQTTGWNSTRSRVWRLLIEPLLEALDSRHDSLVVLALSLVQRLLRSPDLIADVVIRGYLKRLGPLLQRLLERQMSLNSSSDQGQLSSPHQPESSLSIQSTSGNSGLFATTLRIAAAFVSMPNLWPSTGMRKTLWRILWQAAEESISRERSRTHLSAGMAVFRLALRSGFTTPGKSSTTPWSSLWPLAERLAQVVIQAHDPALQDQIIALLVRYCWNSRTTEAERQRLLDLFVRNLEYEYESGRIASTRFLHRLVVSMRQAGASGDHGGSSAGAPVEHNDWALAEYLLVPLSARLVNEQGAEAYQALRACLLALFEPLPGNDTVASRVAKRMPPRLERLQSLLEHWLAQRQRPTVRLAAALVFAFAPVASPSGLLALLLETIGTSRQTWSSETVSDWASSIVPERASSTLEQPWISTCFQFNGAQGNIPERNEDAGRHDKNVRDDEHEQTGASAWYLAYAACRGLENALQPTNNAWTRWRREDAETLLHVLAFGLPETGRVSVLLHPHPWVRAALGRVTERLWHWFQTSQLVHSSWRDEHSSAIAAALCRQLGSVQITPEQAMVVERLVTQLACQLGVQAGPGWRWLVRRLSGMATRARETILARRVALSVLEQLLRQSSAFVSTDAQLLNNASGGRPTQGSGRLDGSKAIEPYIAAWIFPLYRLERAGANDAPVVDPDLEAIAERIRAELEQPQRLGAVRFWDMYKKVTARERSERAARQAARKRLAVTDVVKVAQYKRRRHEHKRR